MCEWEIGNACDTHAMSEHNTIDQKIKNVGQAKENWQKIWRIMVIRQFCQVFLLPTFFVYGIWKP